jgi:hypothetical protein
MGTMPVQGSGDGATRRARNQCRRAGGLPSISVRLGMHLRRLDLPCTASLIHIATLTIAGAQS